MTNINILIQKIVNSENRTQQALENLNSDNYKNMNIRTKIKYDEIVEMLSEFL